MAANGVPVPASGQVYTAGTPTKEGCVAVDTKRVLRRRRHRFNRLDEMAARPPEQGVLPSAGGKATGTAGNKGPSRS
jgi:hypothetical protein